MPCLVVNGNGKDPPMTSVNFTAPSSMCCPSAESCTFDPKSTLYVATDSLPWAFDPRNPGSPSLGIKLSPVDPAMPRLIFAKKVHHVRYLGCPGRASTRTDDAKGRDLSSFFTGITRTCCHRVEYEHGLVTTLDEFFDGWDQNMTALDSMVGCTVASTASGGGPAEIYKDYGVAEASMHARGLDLSERLAHVHQALDQLPHACPTPGNLLATVGETSDHRRDKVDVSKEDYVLSSHPASRVYMCGHGSQVFQHEPSPKTHLPGVGLPDLGTFADGRNRCIPDSGLVERQTGRGQRMSGASTMSLFSILALGIEKIPSQSKERKPLPWEYGWTEALLQVTAHAVLLLLLELVAYSYKKGTRRWQCTQEYYCLLEDPG